MKDLTSEQIKELETLLLKHKAEMQENLAVNSKNCQPVELDPAIFGRLSRMDAIQQQKMAEASHENYKLRLKQIEAALKAIEEGGYGECKSCGEYISYERLKVRPESFICIACKQENENAAR